jgi:hypothetical protein
MLKGNRGSVREVYHSDLTMGMVKPSLSHGVKLVTGLIVGKPGSLARYKSHVIV